jgi:hypothetical protein
LRVQSDGERIDREEVEAAIRRELQILADIETQFENHRDGLDRSVVPPSMKVFIFGQMQWRRRLQRMPHEAAVSSLHQKLLRLVQLSDRTFQ